jgi:hypothetical protein
VIEVRLDEGKFHLTLGAGGPGYADGPAERADLRLAPDTDTRAALTYDQLSVAQAVETGLIRVVDAQGRPAQARSQAVPEQQAPAR